MAAPVEVRLLGRLLVRRPDGSAVPATAWTAGKATDLLRMLALDVGRPVSADTLIERLWPSSSPEAGHASLRTAASTIRTTIGHHCIRTHLGTLTLVDTWVDTDELVRTAEGAARAWRAGDAPAVVRAARRVEALYVGDFHAHFDDHAWASEARTTLAVRRTQLLGDAAESALSLFWLRDAVELASAVLRDDPAAERAHRVLMSAYAAMGHTEQALRQFERCREALADELGADPAEQTRALHLAILAGAPPGPSRLGFVGREHDVTRLLDALADVHERGGRGIVCVVGETGSGRHALVDAALGAADTSTGSVDVWGPLDGAGSHIAEEVRRRLTSRDVVLPDTIVVLTSPAAVQDVVEAAGATGHPVGTVDCPSLDEQATVRLVEAVVRGRPSPALVDAVVRESGGLAGRVVATVRDWLAAGRVVETEAGLDLWDESAPQDATTGAAFGAVLERLADDELRLCELLSLAPGPVDVEDVVRLTCHDRRVDASARSTRSAIDRLVDLGLLDELPASSCVAFRDTRMRSAVASWLRPADRRRLRQVWSGSPPTDEPSQVLGRRAADRGSGDRRQGRRGRRASD